MDGASGFEFTVPITSGKDVEVQDLQDHSPSRRQSMIDALKQKYLQQLKGTRQESQIDNFPEFHFAQSSWSRFWNPKAEEKAFNQWLAEYESYLSQLVSTSSEEQYNSYGAAASRVRSGGANPDLQGVEGAGQASEYVEPETNNLQYGMEHDSPAADILQGAGLAVSFLSGAQSLMAGIQAMQATGIKMNIDRAALAGLDIDNVRKAIGLNDDVGKTVSNALIDYMDADGNLPDSLSEDQILSYVPKSQRKRFEQIYASKSKSLSAKIQSYKDLGLFEDFRSNLAKLRGSAFYDEDDINMAKNYNEIAEFELSLQQELLELKHKQNESAAAQAETAQKQAEYQAKVIDSTSPELQGAAQNAAAGATISESGATKEISEANVVQAKLRKLAYDRLNERLQTIDKRLNSWYAKVTPAYKALLLLEKNHLLNKMANVDDYTDQLISGAVGVGVGALAK